MEDRAFGFEPIHILFTAIGGSLLLAYWVPRLIFPRPPSTSAILILFGMLGSFLFPGAFASLDPTTKPEIWEFTAEIVDGLAFPFVYLALHVAAGGFDAATLVTWLAWDVLYRVVVGAV